VAALASHGEPTGPQEASHLTSIVPVREVQDNLRAEAEVLERFMGTDEVEESLAFLLCKAYIGRFGTPHLRLRLTEDMMTDYERAFYRSLTTA
jgi:hypothetical protein